MSGANGNTSSSSGEPSASNANATTGNGFGSSSSFSSASSTYGASNGSTGPGSILNQPFSAATEAILRRIRGEGGLLGSTSTLGLGIGAGAQPPKYEDVRRSVLESMKTSINMDLPTPVTTKKSHRNLASKNSPAPVSTPTSTSGGGGRKGSKRKQGTKRKRVKEEDEETDSESGDMSGLGGDSDSDGSGSITSMPTQTLSGRKVIRPIQYKPPASEGPPKKRPSYNMKRIGRNVEAALCKRCGRGHSPASNMIVFCDGCNVGWHQMCHDPMVSNETVKDETKEWFCNDCTTKRASAQAKKTSSAAKPTSFAGMSFDEKKEYLSSMPHSHLVNLLLKATTQHPDVQVTPAPPAPPGGGRRLNINIHPQQPFPPSATATAGLFKRAEANPSAPINFIRKIQAGAGSSVPPSFKFSGTPDHISRATSTQPTKHGSAPPALPVPAEPADENEDESRESTPASPPYPRPGNGMMSRLKADDQDLEWLVGEGEDDKAFSQMVFGGEVPLGNGTV